MERWRLFFLRGTEEFPTTHVAFHHGNMMWLDPEQPIQGQALWDLWGLRTLGKLAALVPGIVFDKHNCFFRESDKTKLQASALSH